MRIIDVTKGQLSTPPYPGDPQPKLTRVRTFRKDGFNLSEAKMCLHAGTHADAPLHFLEGGADVSEIPLDRFLNRCRVSSINELRGKGAYQSPSADVPILLLKGEAALTSDEAETLIGSGFLTVGVESSSVGDFAVHTALLSAGIAVIENLDLTRAKEGEYLFCGLPLKLEGAEASPIRAVLVVL